MRPDQERSKRLLGLVRAVALCQRLDAAERDTRKARAALLIAGFAIHRVRLRSLVVPRAKNQGTSA